MLSAENPPDRGPGLHQALRPPLASLGEGLVMEQQQQRLWHGGDPLHFVHQLCEAAAGHQPRLQVVQADLLWC